MKKILLFIVALFYLTHCLAQQSVTRRNNLTDFTSEKYQTVILSNKQVKQGIYNSFYKSTVIANGRYADDKRIGIWHFFDPEGKLLENYNYNTNQLLYEAPEDTSSNLKYIVDYLVVDTTKATKPIRIGGRYFGYLPYLKIFKLPVDLENIDKARFNVFLDLLVSPGGRLADYKLTIKDSRTGSTIWSINVDTDIINEQDRTFIPATLNGQPISSRIIVECYITKYDGLDTY